jgi:hypothetical protein
MMLKAKQKEETKHRVKEMEKLLVILVLLQDCLVLLHLGRQLG